jgi:hypothetical protein
MKRLFPLERRNERQSRRVDRRNQGAHEHGQDHDAQRAEKYRAIGCEMQLDRDRDG